MEMTTLARTAKQRVVMLAYPDAQLLDISGPLQVFASASEILMRTKRASAPSYSTTIVARKRGALRTSSGIELIAASMKDVDPASIDTLLVTGVP